MILSTAKQMPLYWSPSLASRARSSIDVYFSRSCHVILLSGCAPPFEPRTNPHLTWANQGNVYLRALVMTFIYRKETAIYEVIFFVLRCKHAKNKRHTLHLFHVHQLSWMQPNSTAELFVLHLQIQWSIITISPNRRSTKLYGNSMPALHNAK